MKGPIHRDRGMTMVEMLVVITILGVISLVIGATFITILKVTPATAYRIDDARSTRGLQTWLARDVASTPPVVYDPVSGVGFVDSAFASPAAAGVPLADACATSGTHVLFMAWVDQGISYRSQYTIEGDATGGYKVIRTICGGDVARVSLTGDVSNEVCSSVPYRSDVDITDADLDGAFEAKANLCFVTIQTDAGLSVGGDRQEITMSVVSRNGDT
jgi:prepilin-type N-terminal cleavage/methylation domain-containing protein